VGGIPDIIINNLMSGLINTQIDETPLNENPVEEAPTKDAKPKKEKKTKEQKEKDAAKAKRRQPYNYDEPFSYKDFNLWRTYRKAKRFVATWVGLTVCAIWLYYFGVNMNLITDDCYSLSGTYTDNLGKVTTYTNIPSDSSSLGPARKGYVTTSSNNMSYQFRIICVVGTSCWSLMTFISNA
jgi:hypothetical protein